MSENKNGLEIEMTCNNEETASNTDQVSPNGFLPYALSQEIVRALELLGYHEPTGIQREVICSSGRKECGGAVQDGNGKDGGIRYSAL